MLTGHLDILLHKHLLMSLESEGQGLHFILESHFRQPSEMNEIMSEISLKSLANTYSISLDLEIQLLPLPP